MGFTPEQMHGNQITVRTLDLYQPSTKSRIVTLVCKRENYNV